MHDTDIVGWWEWARLPSVYSGPLKAKCDSGARSSALHADFIEIEPCQSGGELVHFKVAPDAPLRTLPVRSYREVRSSNGAVESRPVVLLTVSVAARVFPIECALTSRASMSCPLLLGRDALSRGIMVDPARSNIWGKARVKK